MHDDFDDRGAPHAPSAQVAAGRVPWRGLKATVLAVAVGLAAWFLHERREEAPPPQEQGPALAAPQSQSPKAQGPKSSLASELRSALAAQQRAPVERVQPAEPVELRYEFRPLRFAEFGNEVPDRAVRHVADWAVDSGDHQGKAFVIVDKQGARVWLFNPAGRLVASTPALLGSAVGDDPVPGIGEKPLSQIQPHEKTTPAGRYVAEPGVNSHGEDIVWVSYDLAVSMHRVRATVKAERRLQRLASPTPEDNRISFGCINLPVAFYEKLLAPTVRRTGAIVYVLPETRTPEEQFGSYDVVNRPLFVAVGPARTAHVK